MKKSAIAIALTTIMATPAMAAPVYLACAGKVQSSVFGLEGTEAFESFVVDISAGTVAYSQDVLRIVASSETSVTAIKTELEGNYTLLVAYVDRVSRKVRQQVWIADGSAEAVYEPPFDDGLDVRYKEIGDIIFDCTVSDRKF